MASKKFAQINCSLLRSKKLVGCSHAERWAYTCAHLTPLGNFSGQFRYPLLMWAQDAALGIEELETAITKLCAAGLIEFDKEEEFIRVVGHHRQRPPENASRVISMIGDFSAMELENEHVAEMWLRGIAEFIVAAVKRAQAWKPDSADWPKLRDALKSFTRKVHQEMGDVFIEMLQVELEDAAKSVKAELGSIFPMLTDLGQTPCPHPDDTLPPHVDVDVDVDETNTETKIKTNTNTKTTQNFRENQNSNVTRVEGVELLRKGNEPERNAPSSGPRESTRRSALVMGIKQ